jgi:hypothetical protein
MRLFFALNRGEGLTWLPAGSQKDAQVAATHGGAAAFCAAAARATTLVSWNAAAKLAAIGRTSEAARGLTAQVVDLAELFGPPAASDAQADARGLAARYFAAGAPGLLPEGAAPNEEQWEILHAFERGYNVLCRAVAGAGKTTTLLLCARRRPGAASLLLTYNKRLQLDVAKRARDAALNVEVRTYHAAAGRAYGCLVRNDEAFRRCIYTAPEAPQRFDVMFLDEAQDMSVEFFVFVRYLLRANPGAQLVVVGDERQAINEYRGARPEFLSEAPALYAGLAGGRPWAQLRLSVSHRLTPATAAFVNAHLYRAQVIAGGNTRDRSAKPLYVSAKGKAEVARALAATVAQAVARFGPAGVFVLAASVRNIKTSASPLAELVRRHLAGVPTFVAGDDEATVDADLIRDKMAILSFNSSKGCERPCVIVVGLDETFFRFYDRTWADTSSLPNVLTVAATRASALLVIIASASATIRTADFERLGADTTIRGAPPKSPRTRRRPPERPRAIAVTDLLRHQHPETMRAALALVLANAGAPRITAPVPVPGKVRFGTLHEDLSFAYGLVAPALAEVARTGATEFGADLEAPTIVASARQVRPRSSDITSAEFAAYPPLFWELVTAAASEPCRERTTADWFRLAVARHALWEGRHHIARQVSHYDWVDERAVAAARDAILEALAGLEGQFEVPLPEVTVGSSTVSGRADFVSAGTGVVWEFKFAEELREQDVLQLACYLALRGGGDGVLLALASRETREVSISAGDAEPLLALLVSKIRDPGVGVFALVDAFDRRVADEAGNVASGPLGPDASAESDEPNVWTLEDAY